VSKLLDGIGWLLLLNLSQEVALCDGYY